MTMRLTPYTPGDFERMHAPGCHFLGSSFVPALVLPVEKRPKWMNSPYARALDMLGQRPLPPLDEEFLRRGRLLEHTLVATLQDEGVDASRCAAYAQHERDERWIASPDYLIGEDIIGEGKCPTDWEQWHDGPPLFVQLQNVWQMGCAGTDRGQISALFVDKFSLKVTVWENPLHKPALRLMETEAAKFLDLVGAGKTPDPDASLSSYRALQDVMPVDRGEEITIGGQEAVERLLAWTQARLDRLAAEKIEDAAKYYFASRGGEAGVIHTDNGSVSRIKVEPKDKSPYFKWSM